MTHLQSCRTSLIDVENVNSPNSHCLACCSSNVICSFLVKIYRHHGSIRRTILQVIQSIRMVYSPRLRQHHRRTSLNYLTIQSTIIIDNAHTIVIRYFMNIFSYAFVNFSLSINDVSMLHVVVFNQDTCASCLIEFL
jgi:hypothetical protein